ncbi:hypothetical protein [Fusobacterium nucleatum]
MRVSELEELINKYGKNVTFLEIKDELKKMGYPCNIKVGDKNA